MTLKTKQKKALPQWQWQWRWQVASTVYFLSYLIHTTKMNNKKGGFVRL
jgi:hypothetical protein